MVKIKILRVIFDFDIQIREIPAFRAAVIEKVGRENILFHNHLGQNFRYGYPLIQYKAIRGNPAIVCINEGSEEVLKFFEQTDWDIVLNGRKVEAEIKHLSFDYFSCGISEKAQRYKIHNWFALNEDNFKTFCNLKEEKAKRNFLENIMIGNILSFAKGIQWTVADRIQLTITRIPQGHLFSFKNHQMVGFYLDFVTNVNLPEHIGLGKSVARGFGLIRKATAI